MNKEINKNIQFGLLENGLDFILSSIRHLLNVKSKSDIKYGILHLSSGVELVLKYRLFIKRVEYLFQNPNEFNLQQFINGDFKSVDFHTCIKRLRKYCNINFSEIEDVLQSLREKRNKIEHFLITDSIDAIKAILFHVLSFVIDFIEREIPKEEINSVDEELIEIIRIHLGIVEGFIKFRWNQIASDVQLFAKYSIPERCPRCFQKALVTDGGSKCLFCNYSAQADEIAERYISDAIKDGGKYPQYECPECDRYSFVLDSNLDIWKCIFCGFEGNSATIGFCESCGTPYKINNYEDIGLCSGCIEHKNG